MHTAITLRPATMQAVDLLLKWRHDPQTRSASHPMAEIEMDEHLAWLSRVLSDAQRKLLIAEESGNPVGTVRADFSDGVWELSWTVSP